MLYMHNLLCNKANVDRPFPTLQLLTSLREYIVPHLFLSSHHVIILFL